MDIVASDDDRPEPTKRLVDTREEFFRGTEQDLHWQTKKGTQEFTFGYAITCHKAQGSQWANTIIFDESGVFRDDAMRWKYTAITRSSEQITLVQ
jgi:exodeoxyribonuclease-5